MAYPKQSAEEKHDLEDEIARLRKVLEHVASSLYTGNYRAETLADYIVEHTGCGKEAQEQFDKTTEGQEYLENADNLVVNDALENPRLDRNDSVIRNSRIW